MWIKRFDRMKQVALVGGFLVTAAYALSAALGVAARAVGRRKVDIALTSSLVLFLAVAAKKFYGNFIDNSAGEVLAKTDQDINGKKVGKKGGIFEDNESMIMRQRTKQRERDGG